MNTLIDRKRKQSITAYRMSEHVFVWPLTEYFNIKSNSLFMFSY